MILCLLGLAWAGGGFAVGESGPVEQSAWWTAFDDPQLTSAIEHALEANGTVLAANAQVDAMHGVSRQQFALFLPSAAIELQGSVAPSDSLGFQMGFPAGEGPETYSSGSGMLTVSAAPDVWASNGLQYRAARRDAEASAGERDTLAIATAGAVGEAYFDVVASRRQLELVRAQLKISEELLQVLQLRYEQGAASAVDVLQQRQQVATVKTNLPATRAQLRTRERQLEAMIGVVVATAEDLPVLPASPGLGTPDELLEHRPELQAANARISAAHDRRLATFRAALPSVGLTAKAGWQLFYMEESSTQFTWNAGGQIVAPLYGGGRVGGALSSARATERAAIAKRDQALRDAVAEVENAVVLEEEQLAILAAWGDQQQAAKMTYDEARSRFLEGAEPFHQVVTALVSWQQAELGVLRAHRDLLSRRLALHSALGGPWIETVITGESRR